MASQVIYGKQPVAEAERGRRRVQRVWRAPETVGRGAGAALWVARPPGSRGRGRSVSVRATPRAAAAEDALLVALDQVQDPRNLGAVCRSAEVAGRGRARHPGAALGGGDRRGLQGLGGRGRAPAIAHVRNLADWLAEAKQAGFWIWGADAEAKQAPWEVDLSGPTVLVLGGEGKGLRPRVASACDGLVALPQRGQDRLAQRLRRRRGAALRGRPAARLSRLQRRLHEIRSLGLTELRAAVN